MLEENKIMTLGQNQTHFEICEIHFISFIFHEQFFSVRHFSLCNHKTDNTDNYTANV